MLKHLFAFLLLINAHSLLGQSTTGIGIEYVPKQSHIPDYELQYNLAQELLDRQRETNAIIKEFAVKRMDETKSIYNSIKSKSINVKDGWHTVISLNNRDKCEEAKVFVENNKVLKYYIENWIQLDFSYATIIEEGKSTIQLRNSNSELGDLTEIYFLESLTDSNSTSPPPLMPGKVYFFTTHKKSGEIKIYINDEYKGTIKNYFDKKSTPNCGDIGTLTFDKKPGTYKFEAISPSGNWSGEFSIESEDCTQIGLKK